MEEEAKPECARSPKTTLCDEEGEEEELEAHAAVLSSKAPILVPIARENVHSDWRAYESGSSLKGTVVVAKKAVDETAAEPQCEFSELLEATGVTEDSIRAADTLVLLAGGAREEQPTTGMADGDSALDMLLRPPVPFRDIPKDAAAMKRRAEDLRTGKVVEGRLWCHGSASVEYASLLKACGEPAKVLPDKDCFVTKTGDVSTRDNIFKEGTREYAAIYQVAVSYLMEQGWKKGVGDLGRVYYRGAKGEAKKQGKSHYLSNDLEMLSEVIRLRPDLIKAKLCELGWDA